jgi:two-component system sensor histidine kinase KdpD
MIGDFFRDFVDPVGVAMIYMSAVVISAILYGTLPSLFTSLISILCYDFFFTDPIYRFEIASSTDVIGLALFGASAVVTSQVASRGRAQRKLAERREKVNAGLYWFSRQLSGLNAAEELLALCAEAIGTMLRARTGIFLPRTKGLALASCFPEQDPPDAHILDEATQVWRSDTPPASMAGERPGSSWLFVPLRTSRGNLGVLGLSPDPLRPSLTEQEQQLSTTLADLAAVAIERAHLAEELDRVKLTRAADQLKSVILASLSHDLRTPLTSILGALSSLHLYGAQFDAAMRADLIETAHDEAERLTRFVNNLLDLSRLGSGAIKLAICPVDLSDVMATAVRRAEKMLRAHKIDIDIPQTIPLLPLDPVLMEQSLFNILDNAVKYSSSGTVIQIRGERKDGAILLTISDEGIGIPEADIENIFDQFYRVNHSGAKLAGTGLGLTVCRGFIEAQGGQITAGNRKDRDGSVFTIRFPDPVPVPA